jgi:predicted permease
MGPDLIDTELRHHLAERVDRLVQEGWTRQAAEREARRLFGDVAEVSTQLHHLSVRRRRRRMLPRIVDALWQDLATGLRQFRSHPVSTGAALAVMVIGIGLATAMFSIVDGVLIRPLPFGEPERIIFIREVADGMTQSVSPAAYLHWRRVETGGLELLTVLDQGDYELTVEGEPAVVRATLASHEFFEVMGVNPSRGRGFRADEDHPDAERVVVVSDAFWRRHLDADPEVLGTTLRLQGEAHTVIGITPPGFDFPGGSEVWIPYGKDGPLGADWWGTRFLLAYGRTRDGVDIETVRREMRDSLRGVSNQVETDVALTPLKEHVSGSVEAGLLLLSGAVALVLLVACANVGNLLLSRATGRKAEMALRSALGAGRARILAALITESLVLSLAAGGGGYAFGAWSLRLLISLAPRDLPRSTEIVMDARVLLAAFVVAVTTGVFAALVPALRASAVDTATALREGTGTTSSSRAEGRLQSTLIVAQVALTVVLLVSAGLLGRSFLTIVSQDPGFRSDSVVTAHFGFPRYRYTETRQYERFYAELVERLEAMPAIERAAFVRNLPISRRTMTSPIVVEGREPDESWPQGQIAWVTPGYIETMGIPLVRGRTFTDRDLGSSVKRVLVSESLARTFFPDREAVGSRIRTFFTSDEEGFFEVVGVVGDVRHDSLTAEAPPILYYLLSSAAGATLVARVDMPEATAFAAIEAAVRDVDPEQPVSQLATMGDLLARSVAQPRFHAYLLSGFALIAITLAMVGLYGVMSGAVHRRRFEIGVRMALGADGASVRGLVVREVLLLVGLGAALGLAGTIAASRLLRGLLFEVSPADPVTLLAVAGLVAASALAATYPTLRRAARVDPVGVLKG